MAEVLEAVGVEHAFPLQRMQYAEAMDRFGNDRPDIALRHGARRHHRHRARTRGFKVFAKRGAVRRRGEGHQREGRGRLEPRRRGEAGRHRGRRTARRAWPGSRYTTDGKEKSPIIKFFARRGIRRAQGSHGRGAGRPAAVRGRCAGGGERRALRAAPAHGRRARHAARGPSAAVGGRTSPCSSTTRTRRSTPPSTIRSRTCLDEDVDKIESDPLACGSYSYDHGHGRLRSGRRHHPYPQRRSCSAACLRVCGLTDDEDRREVRPPHPRARAGRAAARRHRARPRPPGHAACGQGVHPRRHRLPEDELREPTR